MKGAPHGPVDDPLGLGVVPQQIALVVGKVGCRWRRPGWKSLNNGKQVRRWRASRRRAEVIDRICRIDGVELRCPRVDQEHPSSPWLKRHRSSVRPVARSSQDLACRLGGHCPLSKHSHDDGHLNRLVES
jgi:hypothetical protein